MEASDGDAGEAADASAPPICAPAATWSASAPLGVGVASDVFGSITPDELTIAWLDASGDVRWADRATATDPWGAPDQVKVQGGIAIDRVALSPDGLRLVVVLPGRRAFAELTRGSRAGQFGKQPDETSFATVNLALSESAPDLEIGDPVLAADDLSLAFSYWATTSGDSIRIATRASKSALWPLGEKHVEQDLAIVGGKRRRPTGLSADVRTLFYWDEAKGEERAAFRGADLGDFAQFVGIGARPLAQPNAACTRLFHGQTIDVAQGGLGLASSSKQ